VRLAHLVHLVRRFVGSLWPGGPGTSHERWAAGHLLEAERRLWARLSGPDRRHAVAVARRVEGALGPAATRPVMAAALLHDVGKLDADLGTAGRVVATVSGALAGRDAATRWSGRPGLTGRVGRYLRHDEVGAALLAQVGSDPLTVAWAREHHLSPERWTLDPGLATALKAADDD
jgi:hypothetical protein